MEKKKKRLRGRETAVEVSRRLGIMAVSLPPWQSYATRKKRDPNLKKVQLSSLNSKL